MKDRDASREQLPVAMPTACVLGCMAALWAFVLGASVWFAVPVGLACIVGAKVAIDRFGSYLRRGGREGSD